MAACMHARSKMDLDLEMESRRPIPAYLLMEKRKHTRRNESVREGVRHEAVVESVVVSHRHLDTRERKRKRKRKIDTLGMAFFF